MGRVKRQPWEEVVLDKSNKFALAVGTTTIEHRGKRIKVDVVKPRYGDATIYFAGTGVAIGKAPPSLVDSITRWRPWSR